jgi:hypothetical protein
MADARKRRRWQESEAENREAIRLKPDGALADNNLGTDLEKQGPPENYRVEVTELLVAMKVFRF